ALGRERGLREHLRRPARGGENGHGERGGREYERQGDGGETHAHGNPLREDSIAGNGFWHARPGRERPAPRAGTPRGASGRPARCADGRRPGRVPPRASPLSGSGRSVGSRTLTPPAGGVRWRGTPGSEPRWLTWQAGCGRGGRTPIGPSGGSCSTSWTNRRAPRAAWGTPSRASRASSQNPFGRSPRTPNAFSSAIPARPIIPSSKSRPISVTPCGTRRFGENFGGGRGERGVAGEVRDREDLVAERRDEEEVDRREDPRHLLPPLAPQPVGLHVVDRREKPRLPERVRPGVRHLHPELVETAGKRQLLECGRR